MEGLKRDTCKVMNAPCSFGRVCLVHTDFCPRYTAQAEVCSQPARFFADASTRLDTCSQSATGVQK